MSSSKKRRVDVKRSNEEDGPFSSPASTGSGGSQRLLARKAPATAAEEVKFHFRNKMKKRVNTENQALNQGFRDYLEKEQDGRPSLLAVNEYIRAESGIKRRYDFETNCDIVAMGNNELNQLGIHETSNEGEYAPTKLNLRNFHRVSAGGALSVALRSGVPYSWGCSDEGMLGRTVEAEWQASTPRTITGFETSEGVKEDGQVMAIAAGDSHILFLTAAGNVYQCGKYTDMEGAKFSDMNGLNGSVKGYNPKPVHVKMPGKVLSIHTQANFNAAVMQNGTVVTWGKYRTVLVPKLFSKATSNESVIGDVFAGFGNKGDLARSAQMTTPDENGKFDVGRKFYYKTVKDEKKEERSVPDLKIIEKHFLAPKTVIYAGPQIKRTVIYVETGSFHLLVAARILGQDFAQLYTSGLNNYGQLGHGDDEDRHELTPVKALEHGKLICLTD